MTIKNYKVDVLISQKSATEHTSNELLKYIACLLKCIRATLNQLS